MTFAEIRTELEARGFEHLTTTLKNNLINRAYNDVCERYPWPHLETNVATYAPLTITDLVHVLNVRDNTTLTTLNPTDIRNVHEADPGGTAVGDPESWYLDGGVLKVWPANTINTFSVRYIKFPTPLSADADIPLGPDRFHPMLVDGASGHAHNRAGEYAAAQECFGRFERDLEQMAYALLVPNYDAPLDMIAYPGGSTDW